MITPERPLQPGDAAPDFALPAVNREGMVSLAAYRGKRAVLLGLYRGLHCPFCRRQVTRLSTIQKVLEQEGVDTIAVVNTPAQRARQYFQYRPTSLVLAADPEVQTHQAFGLREVGVLPDSTPPSEVQWPINTTMERMFQARYTAGGELPEPLNVFDASVALNARDGFEMTEADHHSGTAHQSLRTGHFLIDLGGTVRWSAAEAPDGPEQLGSFPSNDEIVAAARAMSR